MYAPNRWLIVPKPIAAPRLRLFCFPYSGAGALAYRPWAERVPPGVEVCALQLPGRETRLREPPPTDLAALVDGALEAIVPLLDSPFVFFGHSLGALIAFELTRALRRVGAPLPDLLCASARYAPQCDRPDLRLHRMADHELIEQLRRFNGTPEHVLGNQELMALLLPLIRADIRLNETYAYVAEEPLGCAISAFLGADDHTTTYDDVAAWREQTRGVFRLRTLPGGHFFLQSAAELFWRILNHDLGALIERAPVVAARVSERI